jgi:hypothetical protein
MDDTHVPLTGVTIIRTRARLWRLPLPWHVYERIEFPPESVPGIHYLDIPRGYQRSYGL